MAWEGSSLGDSHTCARDAADSVHCWGANYRGQVRSDAPGNSMPEPFQLPGAWEAVLAGGTTTCLLGPDEVKCQGRGLEGQRGNGYPDASYEDTFGLPVPQPSLGGRWIGGDVGGMHVCLLSDRGELACFGSRADGQLGSGGFSGASVPTLVGGALEFTRISLGLDDTAAGLVGGDVYAWGNGTDNQLFAQNQPLAHHPVRLTMTGDHVDVVAGHHFICALNGAGQTSCWGANDQAQLGSGESGDDVGRPQAVPGLGAPLAKLEAGFLFSCALDGVRGAGMPGAVDCWGMNYDGQLGTGAIGNGPFVPIRLDAALRFLDVAVGGNRVFAVDEQSRLWSWGGLSNLWSIDEGPERDALQLPVPLGEDTDWVAISAKSRNICGLKGPDGVNTRTALCAEVLEYGYPFDARFAGVDPRASFEPTPLTPRRNWQKVAAGTTFQCALDDAQGLYCAGFNLHGQLGNGGRLRRSNAQMTAVSGARRYTDVAAGSEFACALEADTHHLYCWGRGHRGQVGLGAADATLPEIVAIPPN